MDSEKKQKINGWLEIARMILALLAGILGGGGAQALL